MDILNALCFLFLTTIQTLHGSRGAKIGNLRLSPVNADFNWIEPGSDIIEEKPSGVPAGCGGKPVDVYIAIDTSEGVGNNLVNAQLDFTRNIINVFDFNNDIARVSLVAYGSDATTIVRLGAYKDRTSFEKAMSEIHTMGGQRSIGNLLNYIRTHGFMPPYSRRSTAHIVIVMTVGNSDDAEYAITEATLLKRTGAYIYGIKVTREVENDLLTKVTSNPTVKFLYDMDGYQIADSLTSLLSVRPCEGLRNPELPLQYICQAKRETDVIFAVDHVSLGAKTSQQIFDFIRAITGSMYAENGLIQVGLAKNRNPNFDGIDRSLETISDFKSHVTDIAFPLFDSVLARARKMFYGGRKGSQKTLVLFVDASVDIDKTALMESSRNKALKIETYVIAVGEKLDETSLSILASGPDRDHIITLKDFQQLMEFEKTILKTICRGW
ncbi:hypothetical protein CHS0354_034115 [Potamilus streckersoni]|uniref:VWFA domain-containing protein n=1 Tax=Potamilus streckersoni TaxID=2493646 RepID=A0AAE0TDD4_9BIVA|nr:hypothetical protein CHS0354_034115 [Potamilus streckersoni]